MTWQSRIILFIMRVRARLKPFSGTLDIEKEREETDTLATSFKPLHPADFVSVSADGVPAEWVVPAGAETERVLLHLHGGSFIAGSIASHRPLAASIAGACRARALLLGYRLAPEHPFPAGLQDTRRAYDWLLGQGYAPGQIVLCGDSAGGALAVGLLIQLRDEGRPLPAAAVLISPLLDLTFSSPSTKFNASRDIMLDLRKEALAMDLYLNGVDPRDPVASPLFADLRGLPPFLIQVGSDEILLSDCTSFDEKARAAGVDVTLEVWDGMQHEWHFAAKLMPEARQAVERIGEFVRRKAARVHHAGQ